MRAYVGDRIVLPGRHVGDHVREGQVVAVEGPDGTPPFVVRWEDGHEATCVPGPEARIEHADA